MNQCKETLPQRTPATGHSALFLRVALGSVYLTHGLAKLFVFTLPGTVAFFESVGFPGLLAYLVIFLELAGGMALILGIGSRWAALALSAVAFGAVSVHWSNGFLFTNESGGWEFPAFLAVVSLGFFLQGSDGALSIRSMVSDSENG